jgi:hypothetical protein
MKINKIAVVIIFSLFVPVVFVNAGLINKAASNVLDKVKTSTVTISDLNSSSKNQYVNKTVEVEGEVSAITKQGSNDVVTIKDDKKKTIKCITADTVSRKVKIGDDVKATGTFNGTDLQDSTVK